MLAFKVEIDDQPPRIVGVNDWGLLSCHIHADRQPTGDSIALHLSGLSTEDDEGISYLFRWPTNELRLGSRVTITVVDVDFADAPIKRYRCDAEVQQSGLTEEE